MYLKRLEVQGFKSFADRVEIEFGPGITVIVGPNGCGKSNLTEAVQWVLGEQNARALRGYKMDDVIFSGTARRRPLGMAEVSITFDNSSGSFPLAYQEVCITRRVYRSGESEYFINKGSCRLRDIQELFSACGIGRAAFFVIAQGKIEEFLSFHPEERRFYLEDVAGVSKYRQRKAEAIKKLEETEQDLLRLRDILGELEVQRAPLTEQAQVAAQYQDFMQTLRKLELSLLRSQFHKISIKKEHLLETYQKVQNSLKQEKRRTVALEEELRNLKFDLDHKEAKISQIEKECAELQKLIQDLSIFKVRREEKFTSASLRRAELESQILLLVQKNQETKKELNEVEEEYRKCTEHKNQLEQDHTRIEKEKNEWEKNKARVNQDWELTNKELLEISQKKTSLISQVREVKNKKEIIWRQQENLKRKAEAGNRRIAEIREQIQEQTRLKELDAASLHDMLQALHKGQMQLQNLRKEKEDLARQVQKSLQKIQREQMRLSFLKEAEENKEGYEKGVKAVLQALAEERYSRQEILGLVEEIFSIEPEYETALDVALGRAAHYLVCASTEVAQSVITYLKSLGAGRASFLPLTALARWAEKKRSVPFRFESKIIGRAADLAKCGQKYQDVAEFLLGRTFIARDLKSARDFAESNYYRVRVVTLEGDLIQPGGLITGGKLGPRSSSSCRRRKEIAQISACLLKYRQNLENLKKRDESLALEINNTEKKCKELEDAYHFREIEKNRREQTLFTLTQELKQLTEFTQTFLSEKEDQCCEQDLDKLAASLEQELSNVLEREKHLEAKRQDLEETRALYEKKLQELTNQITTLKVGLGSLNQELKHLAQKKYQVQSSLARQEAELKKMKSELERANQEICDLQDQEQEIQKKSDELETKRSFAEGELSFRKKQLRARKAYCAAKEKRHQKIKQKADQYQQQLSNMKLQISHFNEQAEQLLIRAREYGIELCEDNLGREVDKRAENKIKEQISELRKNLESLGEVNFTAPGELRRLEERINFLLQQKRDLEEGKEALNRIISKMDQIVVNRFLQAYQEVKKNFEEIFATLCEGGKAELFLSDEKNPLLTGLDLIVLPRGKKPRHLSLLSGGEKALTCIAFLFALLKTRPKPFYFLDEIEAFLDEVNIGRFTNFLKKIGESTQLILISHRYQTMQAADTLYGVTMEEPGVSKLISVNLTDSKWVKAG